MKKYMGRQNGGERIDISQYLGGRGGHNSPKSPELGDDTPEPAQLPPNLGDASHSLSQGSTSNQEDDYKALELLASFYDTHSAEEDIDACSQDTNNNNPGSRFMTYCYVMFDL